MRKISKHKCWYTSTFKAVVCSALLVAYSVKWSLIFTSSLKEEILLNTKEILRSLPSGQLCTDSIIEDVKCRNIASSLQKGCIFCLADQISGNAEAGILFTFRHPTSFVRSLSLCH